MTGVDERPPIWIGHTFLTVSDPAQSAAFWVKIGMREIESNSEVAIMELRGGTHLLLLPGTPEPADAPFDLMVEDIAAAHARWSEQGFTVSAIENGRNHEAFWLSDPDGNRVLVNSSHVMGTV
jgi:catechol 2,3-dioxygenase-like lactoylglutathione lyase family enzyme